jgi:hypothetical protein
MCGNENCMYAHSFHPVVGRRPVLRTSVKMCDGARCLQITECSTALDGAVAGETGKYSAAAVEMMESNIVTSDVMFESHGDDTRGDVP